MVFLSSHYLALLSRFYRPSLDKFVFALVRKEVWALGAKSTEVSLVAATSE